MPRACILLGLFVLGCGAKTELEVPESLIVLDAAWPECRRDRDCDDDVACTDERCVNGACRSVPDDAQCERGQVCATAACDPGAGCVFTPVVCDDGVECTVDRCIEPTGCEFVPDDLRCPVSFRCEADRGCVAEALVHDDRFLYQVDLPSGESEPIVEIDAFTDIALAPDRTLFACSRTVLARIDRESGRSDVFMEAPSDLVALEIGPDGGLYAAGLDEFVLRIDVEGGFTEVYGELPRGWVASGDIAFVGERLLITVTDEAASRTGQNQLAEVLPDGSSRLLGELPISCLWGIAGFGPELYVFSCQGDLLLVDPFTAAARSLRRTLVRVNGAAAR
ncbi:MAG: hypothetical protein AAF411_23430 [Myxococcota bacterium]